ncbi:hypothetical protein E2C01_039542 [Portunus trituberculatus]|uniref:Uncharacterized protein n=1 Tax=Portunus trituberculatus TaxID=210409 RepID=A0A5B7FK43_PORTR|nr:hypothetical protein [Portunus trituberculatus]
MIGWEWQSDVKKQTAHPPALLSDTYEWQELPDHSPQAQAALPRQTCPRLSSRLSSLPTYLRQSRL